MGAGLGKREEIKKSKNQIYGAIFKE